jgi:hypothetical protein
MKFSQKFMLVLDQFYTIKFFGFFIIQFY